MQIRKVHNWQQVLSTELSHLPVTSKEISFSSQHDPVLSKVIECILTGWPDSISEQLKQYHYCRNEISIENLCLLQGNSNCPIKFTE